MKKFLSITALFCCLLIFTCGTMSTVSATSDSSSVVYRGALTEVTSGSTFIITQTPGGNSQHESILFTANTATTMDSPDGTELKIGVVVDVTYSGTLTNASPPSALALHVRIVPQSELSPTPAATTASPTPAATAMTAAATTAATTATTPITTSSDLLTVHAIITSTTRLVNSQTIISIQPFNEDGSPLLDVRMINAPDSVLHDLKPEDLVTGLKITIQGNSTAFSNPLFSVSAVSPYQSANDATVFRGKLLEVNHQQSTIRLAPATDLNNVQTEVAFQIGDTTIFDISGKITVGDMLEIEYDGVLTSGTPPMGVASTIRILESTASKATVYRGKLLEVKHREGIIRLAQIPGDDFGHSEVAFQINEGTIVNASEKMSVGAWLEVSYNGTLSNSTPPTGVAISVTLLQVTAPPSASEGSTPGGTPTSPAQSTRYRGKLLEVDMQAAVIRLAQIPGDDFGHSEVTFQINENTVFNASEKISVGAWVEVGYNGTLSNATPPMGTAISVTLLQATAPPSAPEGSTPGGGTSPTQSTRYRGKLLEVDMQAAVIRLAQIPGDDFGHSEVTFLINENTVFNASERMSVGAWVEVSYNGSLSNATPPMGIALSVTLLEASAPSSVPESMRPTPAPGVTPTPVPEDITPPASTVYRGKLLMVTQSGLIRLAQIPGDEYGASEATFQITENTTIEATAKISIGAWLEIDYTGNLSNATPPTALANSIRLLENTAPDTSPTPTLVPVNPAIPESGAISGTVKQLSRAYNDIVVTLLPDGILTDYYTNYVFLIIPSSAMGNYGPEDFKYGLTLSANYNDVTPDKPGRYTVSSIRSLNGVPVESNGYQPGVPEDPQQPTPSPAPTDAPQNPTNIYRGRLAAVDAQNATLTLEQIPGDDFGYASVVFQFTESTVVESTEQVGVGAWVEIEHTGLITTDTPIRSNAVKVRILAATAPTSATPPPSTEPGGTTPPPPAMAPTSTPAPTAPQTQPTQPPANNGSPWNVLRPPFNSYDRFVTRDQ